MKNLIEETKLSAKQRLEAFFNKISGIIAKFCNWYDELDLFGKKRKERDREFYKRLFQPSVKKLILMNLLHFHYVKENGWSEEEFKHRVKFRPNIEIILVDGTARYPDSVLRDYCIIFRGSRSEEESKRLIYLVDNINT